MIHIDTHVAVWLFTGDLKRFPPRVRRLIDGEDLYISPMAVLEIDLLSEIGRLNVDGPTVLSSLTATVGLSLADAPMSEVIAAARPLTWTRDPFDRLIVASAVAAGQRLLTADKTIRKHFKNAVW